MSELLDSAIVGAIARLKAEPQEKWLSVLQEFAAEVTAISAAEAPSEAQHGKCSDCGAPVDRCAKCTAKAAASGFVKDRAREAVSTYGPVLATKGLQWLQSFLDDANEKAEGVGGDGAEAEDK